MIKRQQRPNIWSVNCVVNQYNLTPSELINVLRTVLQLYVKKAYWYNIPDAVRLFIVWLR